MRYFGERLVVACPRKPGYNFAMSKKPKKATPVPAATEIKTEKPVVLYLRLPPKYEAAMVAYIDKQKAKPDRQAVGLAALELFFTQEGVWSKPS